MNVWWTSKNVCPTHESFGGQAEMLVLLCDQFMSKEIKITKRHLPHWSIDTATYFVTFRSITELISTERTVTFLHILAGHNVFYTLIAFVIMPDHVHLLFHPKKGFDLERIMKGMKGVSANKVNEIRGTKGQVWQHESYDHIIRNAEELTQKFYYIMDNPSNNGITEIDESYKWLYWNDIVL